MYVCLLAIVGLALFSPCEGATMPYTPVINSIVPNRGSYAGGTEVHIFGGGFLSSNGVQGVTTVYIGLYTCDINYYRSSSSQIVCMTPPATSITTDTSQVITVVITNIDNNVIAVCNTDCRFYYQSWITPYLTSLALGSAMGRPLDMYGQLRGLTAGQYSVVISGRTCPMFFDSDSTTLEGNYWGTSYVNCTTPDNTAGLYNVSINVKDLSLGLGDALPSINAYKATGNTIYETIMFPQIMSVTPQVSGLLGGQTVVITGSGFDPSCSNTVVSLGTVSCAVVSCTNSSITCIAGGTLGPDVAPFPSTSGLITKVWYNWNYCDCAAGFDKNPNYPLKPDFVQSSLNGLQEYRINFADTYIQQIEGYFVAPLTANYSFYIASDDYSDLYISLGKNISNLSQIAVAGGYRPTYWDSPSQISSPIPLNQGQRYYIRARQHEGYGGDFVNVAMRIWNTSTLKTPEELRFHNVRERQMVSFTTAVVREVQSIVISGVSSGSFALVGASANPIDITATNLNPLIAALKIINSCGSPSATRSFKNNVVSYNVTFGCPTYAARPLIGIQNINLVLNGTLAIQVTRLQTPSAPLQGMVSLGYNGTWTPLLNLTAGGHVLSAFSALPNVGTVNIGYGGNWQDSGNIVVEFQSIFGTLPLITVDSSLLSGPNLTIAVTKQQSASDDYFYDPIPPQFFEVGPVSQPVVQLTVNNLKATCAENFSKSLSSACFFAYNASLTPVITSVTPSSSAALLPGDSIVITGSGFGTDSALMTVTLGNAPCTIGTFTSASITCVLSSGTRGLYSIQVLHSVYGLANISTDVTMFEVGFRVDSVSLLEDGVEGGGLTTLSGTGFSPSVSGNSITIGGANCLVISASTTAVTCAIPSFANRPASFSRSAETFAVDFSVNNGLFTLPGGFNYTWSLTPSVIFASPSLISAGRNTDITIGITWTDRVSPLILLNDFTLNPISDGDPSIPLLAITCTKLRIGSTVCVNPFLVDQNTLQCTFPRGTVFPYDEQVPLPPTVQFCRSDGGVFTAFVEPSVLVELALRVTAITPSTVSVLGGTNVTIAGDGFSLQSSRLSVSFSYFFNGTNYSIPLQVSSSNFFSISCIFPGLPSSQVNGNYSLDIVGNITVLHNFIQAECNSPACLLLEVSNSVTPVTTSVNPSIVSSGALLEVYGNLFSSNTVVKLDNVSCGSIQYVNSTYLTCIVPNLEAGTYVVSVFVPELGNAPGWPSVITVKQPLSIQSLSVQNSSIVGGQIVTLTGSGFSSTKLKNIVAVGGNSSVITAASYSSITFITPSLVNPSTSVNTVVNVTVNVTHGSAVSTVSSVNCSSLAACQIIYNPSLSPSISALAPSTGGLGTYIKITGSSFGTLAASLTVTIGGAPCQINATALTSTIIYCTVGDVAAGAHPVYVYRAGYGTSLHAAQFKFTSTLLVTGVSAPASLNFGGGDLITITGQGFGSRNANGTGIGSLVSVCNTACKVISSNYTSVQCITSPLYTKTSIQTFANVPTSVLSGTPSPNGLSAAFDNQFTSYYSGGSGTCTFSYDLGAFTNALLTQIRVFSRLGQARLLTGGVFSVSVDGVTFTNVRTLTGYQSEGWNSYLLPAPIETRYIRYTGAWNSYCQVAELQFIGYPFQTANQSSTSASLCAVSIGNLPTGPDASQGQWPASATWFPVPPSSNYQVIGAANSILSNSSIGFVSFSTDNTPLVTGVSPLYGSALGGTVLTIQLTSLPVTDSLSVLVNGYPCTVLSTTSTSISCNTTARGVIWYNNTIVVGYTYQGALFQQCQVKSGVQFLYLDRWSALSTWDNEDLPAEGDSVVIPSGQAVLLDVSPPELFALFVRGVLIFDRQDLTLDAWYIWVSGGRMEVGTESDPFLQKAVITLHGDRYTSVELPNIGSKVLCVSDATFTTQIYGPGVDVPIKQRGVLDIHGKPRLKVWTKVAAPASVGATSIVAQEAVDFQPGETIVITSSTDDFTQTEEVVVDFVESDNVTIHFTPALKFARTTLIYNYNGESIDMRPEIGLLTRNVVIQGDSNSDAQLFGAHTIAGGGGTLRVENTEVRKCGQAFNVGRYCLHFHMAGVRPLNYFKYNSIHNSYQRATTVHGTSYSNVIGNFAYHVMGHTYFVEDGAEMNNLFEGNLGVYTLQSFASLASDVKPATFWTSSPSNFWRSNIAAGSTHFGYWFELPGNPGGPSFTTTICPNKDHLGEFFNNTAHSNGGPGLRIYPHYTPLLNPCGGGASEPTYFYNFTSFRNGLGMFTKLGGDLHHINAKLIENNGNEVQWVKFDQKYSATNPNFVNLLAVAHTNPEVTVDKAAMWLPQNEYFYVSGATFVNYKNAGALSGCFECQSDQELKQGGFTYRFDGLKWDNTYKRTRWTWPFKDIFYDLDGSLTGIVNGTTTEYRAFNAVPECPSGGLQYDNGLVCNSNVRVRRLQIDGQMPTELNFLRMGVNSTAGFGTIDYLPKEISGWVIPIVTSYRYNMSFISSIDFFTLNLRYSEPEYLDVPNEWALLAFNYTNYRYAYQVLYSSTQISIPSTSPLNQLQPTDRFGTSRLGSNISWEIMMTTKGVDLSLIGSTPGPYAVQTTAVLCAPGTCGFFNFVPLGPPVLWSAPSSWPTGVLPVSQNDLNITAGKYVVFDIDSFVVGKLTIFGKLEFDDSRDHTLTAALILVWGIFQIGDNVRPFQHLGRIILTGNRYSPSLVAAPNLKFDLGNKLIANFGTMSFVGQKPMVNFTQLVTTAQVGDSVLYLRTAVDWSVGDELVLTSTDYDTSEVETATVAAISSDLRNVTLAAPLKFKHFSGIIPTGTGASITLASYVGHLTRRIRISGQLSDASDAYGAHVVTADAVFKEGSNIGSTSLQGVGFDACGQQGLATACLQFTYTTLLTSKTALINLVEGCSFKNSFNYGIQSQNTYGLILRNNVFHRTFRNGIDVDPASQLIVVDYNLIAGNYRSPDYTNQWVQPFAAFYIDTASFVSITGNVAGGCNDTAFVVRGDLCTATNAVFVNNEAHSAMIGLFILSSGTTCLKATSFTAWKCSHIGIFTIDQTSNIQLVNPIVSDNHIGISLNFVQETNNVVINEADIIGGIVFGSTSASSCQDALDCHAFSKEDIVGVGCNSVFGSAYRRVGIISSQYLNAAKTCSIHGGVPSCVPKILPERLCSLPWEKRYGLPSSNYGKLVISNTVFGYFSSNDCGRISKAYMPNPSQIDYVPPAYFSGITWTNVGADAKIDLGLTAVSGEECQSACDALNFAAAYDLDGTLFGKAGGTMFSEINPELADLSNCVSDSNTKSIQCSKAYRPLSFENLDLDRGSRRLGSVQLSRFSAVPSIAFSTGPYKDLCPLRFYFGQYPMLLETGQSYNMTAQGTMPASSRITYYSSDPNEVILLRIFFTKAFVINVFVGGVQVMQSSTIPTLASSAGAFALDPQARHLTLILRGNANSQMQVYDLRTLNVVQLTLTSSIPLSQFSGDKVVQNMAALLNIPASRIRIANVHEVVLNRRRATGVGYDVVIADSMNMTLANATMNMEQVQRLNAIVEQVQTLTQTGQLQQTFANSGIPVTSLTVTPPAGAGSNQAAIQLDVSVGNQSSSSSNTGQVIGIAVGVGGGVVLIAIVLILIARRRRNQAARDPTTATSTDKSSHRGTLQTRGSRTPSSPSLIQPVIVVDNPRVAQELSLAQLGLESSDSVRFPVVSPAYTDALVAFLLREAVGAYALCCGRSPCLLVKQSESTVQKYPLTFGADERMTIGNGQPSDFDAPLFESVTDLVEYYSSPRNGVPFVLLADTPMFESPTKIVQAYIV